MAVSFGLSIVFPFVDPFNFLDDATDYEFATGYQVRQGHLIAITIPVARMGDFSDEPSHSEFGRSVGDLQLTYGLELEVGRQGIFAPALSLFVPTGNVDEGYGEGVYGTQFHMPFSMPVGTRSTAYTDAELTFYRGATNLRFVQRFSYLANRTVNLQIEGLYLAGTAIEEQAYICPGIRWIKQSASGVIVEHGVALPIGLTEADDYRAMVYVSVVIP